MPPPLMRLASRCNLVKLCSWNRHSAVRKSIAYTTCSNVAESCSDRTSQQQLEKLGKLKVIDETFKQWEREGNNTFLFFSELKESGFKHDLETYMSVARLLCHWDWIFLDKKWVYDVITNTDWEIKCFEISDHLFEALMEDKQLIKAVQVLVEVYASVGRFEEAMHALSEYKSRGGGLVVSSETCNFVLNGLIEWGKEDTVESVYEEMKRNGGLIPNAVTYALLIRGHCKKGRFKDAWDVFERMGEDGVEPEDFVYSEYIHGLCAKGKTDIAFEVVKNLRKLKKPVDVFADTCIIWSFVLDSRIQDAENVFVEMKHRGGGVVPDAHCYEALIHGYCLNGDIVKGLLLRKQLESRGIHTIDHVFVGLMVRRFCFLGMIDEALYVFKHFKQHKQSRLFLDGASFIYAIEAAYEAGKVDDAMGLLEDMKRMKIRPPVDMHPTGPTTNPQQTFVPHQMTSTLSGHQAAEILKKLAEESLMRR